MRRAALVGAMFTIALLVFGVMQVTIVGANGTYAPDLQDTATATATADAATTATAGADATVVATTVTPDATVTTGADTGATATATGADTGATATVTGADTGATATAGTLTNLPSTGSSGTNLTAMIIAMVLIIFGALITVSAFTSRRSTRS